MFKLFKKSVKITHEVARDEIEELKSLQFTDKDKIQAEVLTTIIIASLNACGVSVGNLSSKVIEKAVLYGLKDLKEAVKDTDKLIIKRIAKAIKNEINSKG